MEIAFHLGAHLTDEDRLVRCLMRNREVLGRDGILVPGPGQYRQHLRKLAYEMRDQPTNADTEAALLDALLDEDSGRRVVFSWENFLSQPQFAVSQGRLYHAAGERVALLRRLFPTCAVSVHLAIRNPATLLPALIRADASGALEREVQAGDPGGLLWSGVLTRILQAAPDVPITVWCDEDTPLLWPEILRAVSGHPRGRDLDGWLGWYADLVTPKGHAAMRRWFAANPSEDDLHRRRTLSALVARFARPEALETEAAIPGWSEAAIEALDAAHEADLDLIAAMPGVRLIEP